MKRWKMAAVLLLVLLCCFGCGKQEPEETTAAVKRPPRYLPTEPAATEAMLPPVKEEWAEKEVYAADQAAYVVFSQALEPREVYVSREYILSYSSVFPECNGPWFRDQLTEEDRCIYNAYLYTMENQFTGFSLYVEDNDRDVLYLREAVSLGSPFMEQNTNRLGETKFTWPSDHLGERLGFGLDQFSEDRWNLKMEVLEKCREIVANIPQEYTTQEEKMEYLYRYVVDHVDYVMYEDMDDQNYLYDAVCRGQSVCDGYSNMLNLLFCLIGVESYEAMGSNYEDLTLLTPEELEEAAGHTWVVAKLGEHFYNFDPTYEDSEEGLGTGDLRYFGFSDDLLSVRYLNCEDLRPQCTDRARDSGFADVTVEDRENNDQIRAAALQLDYRMDDDQEISTILIPEIVTEKQIMGFMDRLIGKTQKLARTASLRIAYLRNATLIELTASHR